jgi:2-polyprenyl-3-methyl-5-hydroxy-6-metoxy-1,4-benzoquinol methylase
MKSELASQLAICPVCSSSRYHELYRFAQSKWIPGTVVRCAECRAIWKIPLNPEKPIAEYYDESYASSDYWAQEHEAVDALRRIRDEIVPSNGAAKKSLLDVGCGPGVFLTLAREAGFNVTGIELNAALADRARTRAKVEVLTGDLMSAQLGDRKFDVITLLDLIEHVPDPVGLLVRCREILNPGGQVVIYTPNHRGLIVRIAGILYRVSFGQVRRPVAEIFDGVHIVFFDAGSLASVMTKAGLKPVSTVMIKYDPARSGQAKGASALALRMIETVSPLVHGQFRLLMIGVKDETTL